MSRTTDTLWVTIAAGTLIAYLAASSSPVAPPPAKPAASSLSDDAQDVLARTSAHHQRRARANPSAWLHYEHVALAELGLAHLTGQYTHYARAQAAVDNAFRQAPKGAGPFLTRARLRFALHRYAGIEADLVAAEKTRLLDEDHRRAIAELRAGLAFQKGDLARAARALRALIEQRPTVTALSRLAQVRWKTGDFEAAEALFVDAIERTPPTDRERHAWLTLMRGLLDLDRERVDEALRHYQHADATFPGWYLIEEHIAEAYALLGQNARARARYEALVQRTNNPEFMDALAEVYRSLGRPADADRLLRRARTRYEARLAAFPEAAYGHALDHYLETGDIARSVVLAEKNAALRPNGEALGKLAAAYRQAGRHEDATRVVGQALQSRWRTPELWATAADVYAAAGAHNRAARAHEHRRRLLAIGAEGADGAMSATHGERPKTLTNPGLSD